LFGYLEAQRAALPGPRRDGVDRLCRFHGAGGGGPQGQRNGAYRHGRRTADAVAERKAAIPDGLTTWAPPAADFPSVMQHPMATDPAIAALPPGYTIEPASARPTGIPPPPGFVIQPAKPDRAPVAAPDELSWDAVMTPSQSQSTPKSRPLRLARFAVLFPLAVVAFLSFLAGRAGRYILAGPG